MTNVAWKFATVSALAGSLAVTAFADWPHVLDSGLSTFDAGYAVTVDKSGFVYVAGYFDTSDHNGDMMVAKYDRVGNYYWTSTWDSPTHQYDIAKCLVVDGSGNVYVAGESRGTSTSPHTENSTDIVVASWDLNGEFRWAAALEGSGGGDQDVPASIKVDANGDAIVAGSTLGPKGSWDVELLKYKTTKGQKLFQSKAGFGTYDERARDLAIDGLGNAYVAGTATPASGYSDVLTVKFDANGEKEWIKRYDAVPKKNSVDEGVGIQVDNDGNVYVAATLLEFAGSDGPCYGCIKYTNAGGFLYGKRYSLTGDDSVALGMALDRDKGKVYITGYSVNSGDSYFDVATAKF